jgi:hypothetical protein
MQKALDEVPKIVKRQERAAREKKKILKNFERSRAEIFGDREP